MSEEKPKHIVLFGATGMIGSRILKELLARGHTVTVMVRDTSKWQAQPNVSVAVGDIFHPGDVSQATVGADVVISAYGPGLDPEAAPKLLGATNTLMAGLRESGARRLIAVGGAGSLFVAPGLMLVDAPSFPKEWKAIALAHRDAFNTIRQSDHDWTYVSPAAEIAPGERTGKLRIGGDQLLSDPEGHSRISAEDFAVAVVDEVENPQHIRQRFTVAY